MMQNQAYQANQVTQTQPVPQNAPSPVSQGTFDAEQTWTLKQFMIQAGFDKVDVVRNPHTGKLFVSFGGNNTAAYSTKLGANDLSFDLSISLMKDGAYIVHKGGSSENVQASLSL